MALVTLLKLLAPMALFNPQLLSAMDDANTESTFDPANAEGWYNLSVIKQHFDAIVESPLQPKIPASAPAEAVKPKEEPAQTIQASTKVIEKVKERKKEKRER
jgi:hypothetical protein